MAKKHNDFIFETIGNKTTLIRDFEGMYRDCEDPHGQSKAIQTLSYQLVLSTVERTVEMVKRGPNSTVTIMDMGCGLGYFTKLLKKKFPAADVRGADISSAALAKASRRAPECVFQQIDLKTQDPLDLRIQFDVMIALDCLYYFNNDEILQVLANIRKLMVDGGFLVVGYHLPETMNFGLYIRCLNDAKSLFQSCGLSIVYSFDVEDNLDITYTGTPVGRHLYFLAKKLSGVKRVLTS